MAATTATASAASRHRPPFRRAGNDFVADGTGDDFAEGGDGDDSFESEFGSDALEGGAGNDRIVLRRSIGQSDPSVVNGGAGNHVVETIIRGTSSLTFDGGEGDDTLEMHTPAGSCVLTLGTGRDTVTGTAFDRIEAFQAAIDRIDLPFTVSGWTGNVQSSLSEATFDTALAAAVNGTSEAFSAVLFPPDSASHAGKTFVVVGGNGDGTYQAGADYVFQFVNPVQPLNTVPGVFA
jgi:Ca2+-binding RTX toxin-like protein